MMTFQTFSHIDGHSPDLDEPNAALLGVTVMKLKILVLTVLIQLAAIAAVAQTTEFTYQGQLQSASAPANGNYDFEFVLYDSPSGGVQSTPVLPRSNVGVANGIFSVTLDFGAGGFPGSPRYLEIRVRQSGGGAFTTLAPRQVVGSSPYSLKTLSAINAESSTVALNAVTANNATNAQNAVNAQSAVTSQTATNALNLGGVAANQFIQTNDTRLADARPPIPGSSSYVQNTTAQQGSTNFNISGIGTAGSRLTSPSVHAQSEIRMGGSGGFVFITNRTGGSMSIGPAAGHESTGSSNTFVGNAAGRDTTTGSNNSAFGIFSGARITTGSSNSFFGSATGDHNTTGFQNSFFGASTGGGNTTASRNSFFGFSAGGGSSDGSDNSFFGTFSGQNISTGSDNTFVGAESGQVNTAGSFNTFIGKNAGKTNSTGVNNTFVGFSSGLSNTVAFSNSFFGFEAGRNNTTGDQNAFFGQASGMSNQTANNNSFFGQNAGSATTTGGNNTFAGKGAGTGNATGSNNTLIGYNAEVSASNLTFATAIGADAIVSNSNTVVLGRAADSVRAAGSFVSLGTMTANTNLIVLGTSNLTGIVDLGTLGAAGSQAICRNASGQISTCSSSLRYKTNINGFGLGLNLINQLKPITFDWKDGGMHDLGLGAEDVAAIEPLLVTYNTKGEVEGVKYDRIGVVLINAVKEQQRQIEALLAANAAMLERLRAVEKPLVANPRL
ncbi:MAG: tail fiber domain-containing protein [Pyrinomonadaceae bacterium]